MPPQLVDQPLDNLDLRLHAKAHPAPPDLVVEHLYEVRGGVQAVQDFLQRNPWFSDHELKPDALGYGQGPTQGRPEPGGPGVAAPIWYGPIARYLAIIQNC